MSSALQAFKAQREEVERLHVQLTQVVELLRAIRAEATTITHDDVLRKLPEEEQTWLLRTQDLIKEVRHFREAELNRIWPGVWRRWVVAIAIALAASAAFGAGHVWASRPYESEMASLRFRVEVLDSVAARILGMTPAERRQFEVLMKLDAFRKRKAHSAGRVQLPISRITEGQWLRASRRDQRTSARTWVERGPVRQPADRALEQQCGVLPAGVADVVVRRVASSLVVTPRQGFMR